VPLTFKDSKQREYSLTLHAGKSIEIERDHGVNLRKVLDGKLIDQLDTDDSLFVRVLYELAKESADEYGISPEDFARSLNGDAMESGRLALLECLVDFSRPGERPALRTILDKTELVHSLGVKKVEQEASSLTTERIQTEIDRRVSASRAQAEAQWPSLSSVASPSPESASQRECPSHSDSSNGCSSPESGESGIGSPN
jgi:hypothetical protein